MTRTIVQVLQAAGLLGMTAVLIAACSGGNSGSTATPTATPAAQTLAVASSVDHLDTLAREPMVVEHPNGTLFVSGYGSPSPALWKSVDKGATWARVDVGTEADGAIGNSDIDLAVARDGTLYFATMVFDRKALEGASISIGVSYDIRGGVRGKYYERYKQGTNVVLLEPDLAKVFRDSDTVNEALRQYLSEHGTPPTVRKKAG